MLIKHLPLIALLLISQSVFSLPLREQESNKAKQDLIDLNFFHNGRGMLAPPNFPPFKLDSSLGSIAVDLLKKHLRENYGILTDENKILGVSQQSYKGVNATVIGCAACHVGRAAGITIPGLGNKNFDVYALGQLFRKNFDTIENGEELFGKGDKEVRKSMFQNFKTFMTNLSDPNLNNSTQGLVPTGIIRKWFYDDAQVPMDTTDPGQVKIPSFWGYAEKRKVGSFADGFGNGVLGGWAIAVELVAGQTVENVKQFTHKIEVAEEALGKILPPKYPFSIDKNLAQTGEGKFVQNCASCHGTYSRDQDKLPLFEAPRWVPIEVVKTDQGRLQGLTPLFTHLVDNNPLKEIIQRTELGGRGFFAPRLLGIWSRFPYLHNGSVPSIADLLNPPAQRPQVFSLKDASEKSRFDEKNLGLNVDKRYSVSKLTKLAKEGTRWVYDTKRDEAGNGGHYFSNFQNLTPDDKAAIIEYLKTL